MATGRHDVEQIYHLIPSSLQADFEEQNISTFREQDGRQKERKAAFERAVLKASAPSSAGRGIVLVVVVDHKAARFHLPLFLATLRGAGGLDASLVVTNLNQAAQEICSRVSHTFSAKAYVHPAHIKVLHIKVP